MSSQLLLEQPHEYLKDHLKILGEMVNQDW